jgi:signal peptidase I
MKTSFENELNRCGYLVYTNTGYSMMPMLHQHHDVLMIEKPKGRLKKYDIPLYRAGGKYILHRILEVRPEGYVTCGDNNIIKEYVPDGDVIGVLTSYTRDGKVHRLNEPSYRLYVHLWCDCFPLRVFYLRARRFASRQKHKLVNKFSESRPAQDGQVSDRNSKGGESE